MLGVKLFLGSLLLALASGSKYDKCYDSVIELCHVTGHKEDSSCNSVYGGFQDAEVALQSYANSQIATSYDYLLLASRYSTYQHDRPGLHKVFQDLSTKAWQRGIALIRLITKRGGKANLNQRQQIPSTISHNNKVLEVDEFHAIGMALDSEKKLAMEAQHLHSRVSRMDHHHYDPQIADFIADEFLSLYAHSVRKLSGLANDMSKLLNQPDPSLAVHLFDEHLKTLSN